MLSDAKEKPFKLNQCVDRNEHTMCDSIIEMTHGSHSLNYEMTILSCVTQ